MAEKPTYSELEAKTARLEADLHKLERSVRAKAIGELKWQWQTTFDTLGVSICVLDADFHVLQCNRATTELLGKTQQEILGCKCFELVHGSQIPHANCPIKRLAETRQRQTEVLKLGDRWVEVSVDPILDDEGELKGIVHIINDISEHKSLVDSLKQREDTLQSIFKAAPIGIGMVVDRVLVQVNNRLCDMTGYTREEMVGNSARILYPDDEDYEYVGREKYRQITEFGTGTVETRWQHKNGRIFDVLLSSTPFDRDNWAAGVTFTALDITERKRAEEELACIFEMSLDLICIADIQTATFTKVNPAFSTVLGYPGEELLGRPFLEFIHPDDVAATAAIMKEKLSRGEKVINFENRYRCKNGEYRWLSWVSHPDRERGLTYAVARDISERKRQEAAQRFAAQVVKEIPSGLFIYDFVSPDRLILYQGNPAAQRLTGIVVEEWIGREFNELWPEAHATGITDAFLNVMKTGRPYYTEALTYQDSRLQGAFKISAFTLPENRLCVAFENITERKKSEEALDIFRTAVEVSTDAIGMSTPQGKHWYQNRAFDDLFGAIGDDPPASAYVDESVGRQVFETIMGGKSWVGEVEMHGRNTERLQVLLRAYAVKNQSGKISSLVGVHTDITERKTIENQLQQSVQRFRSLAELLPQTVFEMAMDGKLTFVNRSALKIFGYRKEELRKGLYALDMIAPEDRDATRAAIEDILAGRAGHIGQKFTAIRSDGSTFPVLIYSSVNVEDGAVKGLRGIIIDISEQERLIQERDRLEEQYIQSQKMEAVGRLAGGVAHDLNNMLSPIVGYSELMISAMAPDAPDRADLEQILNAGLRAKEMVRQLLAFSRKQALEIKSVNLKQVLLGFEKLLDRILRDDVELALITHRGIPNVLADAGQIEQVVMNLAVNAQDAMPEGGRITITLDTVMVDDDDKELNLPPGQYVELMISDTGHGIDERTQARIFDPFFTTKSQGKGTGLGLATVYGIVKQHNGSISVQSEAGKGTIFRIHLPAALSDEREVIDATERTAAARGNERILIVEDNDAVRRLAENILSQFGYRTTAVGSGRECLALIEQRPSFDLMLTDVVLKDTNGKELCRRIKQYDPNIKVLYMTGYTDDVIVHHGVLEEGVSLIQKPFSVRSLLEKVRQVLEIA